MLECRCIHRYTIPGGPKNAPSFEAYQFVLVRDKTLIICTRIKLSILRLAKRFSHQSAMYFRFYGTSATPLHKTFFTFLCCRVNNQTTFSMKNMLNKQNKRGNKRDSHCAVLPHMNSTDTPFHIYLMASRSSAVEASFPDSLTWTPPPPLHSPLCLPRRGQFLSYSPGPVKHVCLYWAG